MNLSLMVFIENNLPTIKDGMYVKNLNNKQGKGIIGFHYLLTEILLSTLIPLELKRFLKIYWQKSKMICHS